ncbi:MAG TPA: hypothetical protein GX715_15780 [Armatimonadetes bacterium]|jgi:hypothetical protein|nr:hypothetical protein [Armatimonadota bacterium]
MARKNATGLGFWTLLFRTLVGAALGAGIVTGIVWLIPRYYTSSTVLLFPGAKGSSGASTSSAPSEGGATADQPSVPLMQGVLSVPRPGTSPSTAALILTSRKVTVDLINRFDLAKEWNRSLERSILRFHERFVCQEGKAGDLRVSFTDRDPQRARAVVEAAIETLKRSVEDLSLDPAARNVDFLRDNVEDAEASCARIQREIVKLQRGLGGSPPDTQVQALSQILNDIQRDLTNAEVDANVAKSSMQATTETAKKMIRAAQDPAGSESMLIRSLYQDVAQKEADLALLREKFTDRRAEVVQARQALNISRKSLEKEIARQLESVEKGSSPLVRDAVVRVVTAQARVDGLRQCATEIRERLEDLPAAQVRYAQLQADLRDERSRLTLLRSEYLRAQLIVESRGPQFVMLDPPILPKRPNGWELYYWSIAGAIIGGLSVAVVAFTRWLRQSLQDMGM